MTVRERIGPWIPVGIAGAVLGVGALVAIPLGGWDTVELRSAVVPEHPIGEPYAGHRVSTAIDEVYLTSEHPDGFTEPEPGETFLVVEATIENLTDEPQVVLGSPGFYAFTVPGVLELDDPRPLSSRLSERLLRDDAAGGILNPGVPDAMQFVFTIEEGVVTPGQELRIGLTDAIPQDADLYEGTRWMNPQIEVEVPIVVEERG